MSWNWAFTKWKIWCIRINPINTSILSNWKDINWEILYDLNFFSFPVFSIQSHSSTSIFRIQRITTLPSILSFLVQILDFCQIRKMHSNVRHFLFLLPILSLSLNKRKILYWKAKESIYLQSIHFPLFFLAFSFEFFFPRRRLSTFEMRMKW